MKHLDIKRALADHNITQVQLGEKLGLSPQSLTSVIKGNPTVKKLEDIATAIGCDITDLFYPDPAEEAEAKEIPAETENDGETLNATLRGDLPEGIIEREVNFVQQPAGSEPAYPVHENGLVSENQQQMIQTSTFCPHCGKKVRVGVVLLSGEC
jgi:transcriptional regulator with XRE-family HTH domain|uniref:Helix-turn-helix domain protein n=1 Tax=virus sp. ctU8j8 TaxID=2827991 RepID=A0A8S5RWS2_9VIRU|nr:MAG TPA: helix-turn-helix domain protein [virus sp. ctU8j8]